MAKTPKIPYGIKDFRRIREEVYYYVDKMAYIRRMEERDSFAFFVRPRRVGKSLFVETLCAYYDVNKKANFRKLFGGGGSISVRTPPRTRTNTMCSRSTSWLSVAAAAGCLRRV